jgi:hypothetical protein
MQQCKSVMVKAGCAQRHLQPAADLIMHSLPMYLNRIGLPIYRCNCRFMPATSIEGRHACAETMGNLGVCTRCSPRASTAVSLGMKGDFSGEHNYRILECVASSAGLTRRCHLSRCCMRFWNHWECGASCSLLCDDAKGCEVPAGYFCGQAWVAVSVRSGRASSRLSSCTALRRRRLVHMT